MQLIKTPLRNTGKESHPAQFDHLDSTGNLAGGVGFFWVCVFFLVLDIVHDFGFFKRQLLIVSNPSKENPYFLQLIKGEFLIFFF